MGTAFERFDVNADGDLSLEEFQADARSGLSLCPVGLRARRRPR